MKALYSLESDLHLLLLLKNDHIPFHFKTCCEALEPAPCSPLSSSILYCWGLKPGLFAAQTLYYRATPQPHFLFSIFEALLYGKLLVEQKSQGVGGSNKCPSKRQTA